MTTIPSFVVEFDLVARSIQYLEFNTFTINPGEVNKIYWIHCELTQQDALSYLVEKLDIPQDIVASIARTDKTSQILEREETFSFQMECIFRKEKSVDEEVETDGIFIHLANRYCLTASRTNVPILEELMKDLPNSIQYAKTPCFILFLIFDKLITHYTDILYEYEIIAEDLDEHANQEAYKQIHELKKRAMNVKRHLMIVLNILLYITGRDIKAVSKHCKVSLATLLNNTQTIINEADSIRDLLHSTLDQIDNTLMREVNSTMRVLTAVAAIFMPPSLIAGIYGMNFRIIPELSWTYGYPFALVLMLASMVGMLYYFKRNKWY